MLESLNIFAFKLAPIFYQIVYMSVIASIVGIVILIIRKIFSKMVSPKWISRLWILIIIALICPIQMSSKLSIYNYMPQNMFILFNHTIDEIPSISFREEYDEMRKLNHDLIDKDFTAIERKEIEKNTNIAYIKSLVIDVAFPYIWLFISATLIITHIVEYIIFSLNLRKYEDDTDTRIHNILDKCKAKLNINKKIKVIKQQEVKTPSLFGIFKITILISNNIYELTDSEIEYIFMHELAHYKRKDNISKLCIVILKYLYIFNPIIYLINKQILKDFEVASDEIATENLDAESKKDYCKTLIKVTDNCIESKLIMKTLSMSDSKNELKRRISMIKLANGFIRNNVLITVAIIVIMGILGAAFLTRPNNENKVNNVVDKPNDIYDINQTVDDNNVDMANQDVNNSSNTNNEEVAGKEIQFIRTFAVKRENRRSRVYR